MASLRLADHLLDRDAELLEEARRLLAVVLGGRDRRDDQALARTPGDPTLEDVRRRLGSG